MVTAQMMNHKIQPRHLTLLAYIYVRQSSDRQMRENTGSTEVQRQMREHAVAYGFAPENIRVIEQDQGRTAATMEGRDGFRGMLSDVLAGRVGAIFCSHTSRLARDSKASKHLILCCESAGTLIIDQHGVYDPRNENDLFFLGIKGVVDEVELRRIRTLLFDARIAKVKKGEFRLLLPVGFVWTRDGKIAFDPDEEVRRAVQNAFNLFDSLGSAMAVARHFNDNGLLFPKVTKAGPRKGDIEWSPLTVSRLTRMYHHPIYRGAYVYGRTRTQTDLTMDGDPFADGNITTRHRTVKVQSDQWAVLIPDFHKGYVTAEQQQRIQERLASNHFERGGDASGAPRAGAALLQGIVACAKCGWRLTVLYSKRTRHEYLCTTRATRYGGKQCASFPGLQVDNALVPLIFQAFEPSQLEMSIDSVSHADARAQEVCQQLDRNIKRAREDAEYALYRYKEVDPKNVRLAKRLEEESEEKFAEVERLTRQRAEAARSSPKSITPSQVEEVMALARDIPQVWRSEKMTPQTRKMLIRAVVNKVEIARDGKTVRLTVWWMTGARTETMFTIRHAPDFTRADSAVVEMIRSLALEVGDREIAVRLNAAGYKTGSGQPFTRTRVGSLRVRAGIVCLFPESPHAKMAMRVDGRYSVKSLAEMLQAPKDTLWRWCLAGRFDAIRYSAKGAWWIKISPPEIEKLRAEVSQRRGAKKVFAELVEV